MKKSLLSLAGVLLLAGCGMTAPFKPSGGSVYDHVKAPLQLEYNSKTELGSKVGKATATSVLGLVAWGDAGLQAAADDGDIRVIRHVDYEYQSILFGVYTETTVIVYGD